MNYAGYIHRYKNFAFGGALTYLDSGSMEETTEFNPLGTGRTFRTIHMAAALTMAQELTNLFSYGITMKYLDERVEEVQVQTVGSRLLGSFLSGRRDRTYAFAIGLTTISGRGSKLQSGGDLPRLTAGW